MLTFNTDRKKKSDKDTFKFTNLIFSENDFLVPCIVFYFKGDKVKITEFSENKI